MFFVVLIIIAIIALFNFIGFLRFKHVCKLFEQGSVSVFGVRGSGKDMLFSNVVSYRNKPYISNVEFTKNDKQFIPWSSEFIQLGGNGYRDLVANDVKNYIWPVPDGTDIYISDCGIYFPAQYHKDLDKLYPEMPIVQALLRHLGNCSFHFNTQALNRVWDKLREQSDTYILCKSCKVRGKIVTQKIVIYEKYQSAVDKVAPFRMKRPLLSKDRKQNYEIERVRHLNSYGKILPMTLKYRLNSKYDTRKFSQIFAEGKL